MCGIAGFYHADVDEGRIGSIIAELRHRGPDDSKVYIKGDVGLIHTRLSIIELTELGSQPYRFEHLVLIFNGELYNYAEVREELKNHGYSFHSNADTEVLIKAFHFWGERCIDRFIGMFAFCIYDEKEDCIFLLRDRIGVKPLYYYFQEGTLFFASELKALSIFPIGREINVDAVSLYFRFGFIPHPLSIYKFVSKLEPGHCLRISRGGLRKTNYWTDVRLERTPRSEDDLIDELEAILISAFKYRMVSDVPVGVFLSGGVDSSLLTAILRRNHGGIHTFTMGFDEPEFDESGFAKKVAEHLDTDHAQKTLNLGEAHSLFRDFYSIFDEPFADTSGIPTSCLTRFAKEHGMKVVLSADGGDELFGGYTHYMKALQLYHGLKVIPVGLRRAFVRGAGLLFPERVRRNTRFLNLEHKAYAFEELLAAEDPVTFFEGFLANQSRMEVANMMAEGPTGMGLPSNGFHPLDEMMTWDFRFSLPGDLLVKVDRATMFHGIECREPFLDHRLAEFAAKVPPELKIKDGKGKYLLRKLLRRYLPEEYFERPKQGFSIPIFKWFRKDLDEMFYEYLSDARLDQIPFFHRSEIQREHGKYLHYKEKGWSYNIEKMWRLLSFMMWWERYHSA